jgi:FAD/FMN-containing dehydrogenase
MVIATKPTTNATQDPTVRAFAARLTGTVVTPEDEAYDTVRKVQLLNHDRRPAVIVRPANATDIAEAVRFARAEGREIAVRSGGHSIPGYSMVDGAVVIDMSAMREFHIDPQTRTLWAQPGVTTGDIIGPAGELGLALSTGDATSVGLGGLTLGGGIGWMVRKYGLAIDNLTAVELVTADGEVVRASASERQDLFWAVRGGGGNFGIITAFEFRMAEVPQILGGALVLPPDPDVIRRFGEFALSAPDELTTIAALMRIPPVPFVPAERHGEMAFVVLTCWAGDIEEGQRAIAPMRALAEPIADTIAPVPYATMYNYTAEASQPHFADIRQTFVQSLDGVADLLVEHAGGPSPINMVQVRPLGGAFGRVSNEATAFSHRDKNFLVAAIAIWDDAAHTDANRAWMLEAWKALRPHGSGVYSNFISSEGEDRVHDAYSAQTYARLAQVKRRYDPANVFHLNQNVKPA